MTITTANHTLAADAETARRSVEEARAMLRRFTTTVEINRYNLAADTVNNVEFQLLREELRADLAELDRAAAHLERVRNVLDDKDGELSFVQNQVKELLEVMQAAARDSITGPQAQYFLKQAVRAFYGYSFEYIRWGLLHETIFDDTDAGSTVKAGVTLDTVRQAVADSVVAR